MRSRHLTGIWAIVALALVAAGAAWHARGQAQTGARRTLLARAPWDYGWESGGAIVGPIGGGQAPLTFVRADVRTGQAQDCCRAAAAIVRRELAMSPGHAFDMSPDGRWMLVQRVNPVVPGKAETMTTSVVRLSDGKQLVYAGVPLRGNAVWLADSTGWAVMALRKGGWVVGTYRIRGGGIVLERIVHLPLDAFAGHVHTPWLVGVAPDGTIMATVGKGDGPRSTIGTWGRDPVPPSTGGILVVRVRPGASAASRWELPLRLAADTPVGLTLSSDGGRLACLRWDRAPLPRQRDVAPPAGAAPVGTLVPSLWTVRADGTGMKPVNWQATDRGLGGSARWLPDGRHVSVLVGKELWAVPVGE